MITFGFLIISIGIFALFSIQIILLGFFFQYFVLKKSGFDIPHLLISFGVGYVLYVIYSYLVIDFFRFFNVLTIYLPLTLFNLILSCYFIKKENGNISDFITRIKHWSKNIKNRGNYKKTLLILIPIILLYILLQSVIETHLNYPSMDPYVWFNSISYLTRYMDFDYDFMQTLTGGYVLFGSGALLIVNNFTINYFFVKYLPAMLFIYVILSVYCLSKKIFKKNFLIFFTLLILLSFNFLLYRYTMTLPSNLAVVMGSIFMMTIMDERSKQKNIKQAILIAGVFLSHILYGFFMLVYFLSYLFFFLLLTLRKNLKSRAGKNSLIITGFFKDFLLLITVFVIILVPYFINVLLNGYDFFGEYFHFFNPQTYFNNFSHDLGGSGVFLIYLFQTDLVLPSNDLLFNLVYSLFNGIIWKTLVWGIIILVIGLFFHPNSKNSEYPLIIFVQFSFILTFLVFFLNSFLMAVSNVQILAITEFFNTYWIRTNELFSPGWALLFIWGFHKFFLYIKVNIVQGKQKIKDIKGRKEHGEMENREKIIYISLLVIIGSSLYISHLYYHYEILYTSYYEDDELSEALIYMGEYFSSNLIENQVIKVSVPNNTGPNVIYRLLYYRDLKIIINDDKVTEWDGLGQFLMESQVNFSLVRKSEISNSCFSKIIENQILLYQNSKYVFFM